MELKTKCSLTPSDIFQDYGRQMVESNPQLELVQLKIVGRSKEWAVRNKASKTIVICYTDWHNIVSVYMEKAKEKIIQGFRLSMGRAGNIYPKCIERNFNNKVVDWTRTRQQPKTWSERRQKLVPEKIIYHADNDYCRIAWGRGVGGIKRKFKPTKSSSTTSTRMRRVGFSEQFSRALKATPALKYRYVYAPYNKLKPDGA